MKMIAEELTDRLKIPVYEMCIRDRIICDSYNYSVEREYANKVDAELREKDYKLMKEEKLRIETVSYTHLSTQMR